MLSFRQQAYQNTTTAQPLFIALDTKEFCHTDERFKCCLKPDKRNTYCLRFCEHVQRGTNPYETNITSFITFRMHYKGFMRFIILI